MIYSIVYYSIFIVYVQYGASVVFNNSFILGNVLEAVKRAYHALTTIILKYGS